MGVVYNRRTYGLFENGCFQDGTNRNFSHTSGYTADSLSNGCCGLVTSRNATFLGDQFIPVDTSKTYQIGVSVRTLENNYLGNPGSGHLGFACFDQNKIFIDRRNCGGIGNTTLSRDLNAGDSYVYITSSTGWSTSTTLAYTRHLILFPATHPKYSIPHRYSRIGFGDYNLWYSPTIELMAEGDYRLTLQDGNGNPITFPNIGYPTPAGTPISNSSAGGTYNYAMGNPNYPATWTRYSTVPFTGEHQSINLAFRRGTSFIRFMNLTNYNFGSQSAGTPAKYLVDNIILLEVPNGRSSYPTSVFSIGASQ